MQILFNLSTAKNGGGQNVVLNFLGCYFAEYRDYDSHLYIVAEGTLIERYVRQYVPDDRIIVFPRNPFKRMIAEILLGRQLKKKGIDVIYTYWGFGLFLTTIPQIIGAADSNLFFPEIDFWEQYSGVRRIFKKIIDNYRIFGLKRASGIIFETKLQEQRCRNLYSVNAITKTIKPSINIAFSGKELNITGNNTERRGLFLCGWQLNKNIMLIPEIAKCLKEKGFEFSFVVSAPNDTSQECKRFYELVERYDVKEYINHIGTVDKEHLSSLYSKISIVFLLSKLESFSNNIIEAWTYGRLLMISDETWSRSICGDAALYVERDNVSFIADSIISICNNHSQYCSIVEHGKNMLEQYPTIQEKTQQEIDFIYEVYAQDHN